MIARVAREMAFSARLRSMLRVRGSTSANTGRAPTSSTTFAVATHESGVVITSSPLPMPARRSAISSVTVPELKARTGRPPQSFDSAASNAFTCGPEVIQPERITSATPAMVASSMLGRVKGRKSWLKGRSANSRARHQEHADDDDTDSCEPHRREDLAEEVPGRDRVHHVADREHGVGDAHRNFGKGDDPHHHADHVAGEAAQDVRLE